MFGGPIDLTPFGSVIKGIGILYWVLALGCLAAALAIPKKRIWQAISVAVVMVLFGYAPVMNILAKQERAKLHQAQKERFEMRCKDAGVKIYKTVENVEGVLLLKVRPKRGERELADQMWPGAAFAYEATDDSYIESFLLDAGGHGVGAAPSDRPGYQFVDIIESDNKRYRYRIEVMEDSRFNNAWPTFRHKLMRQLTTAPPPRYGVTYEDDVNPKDRKLWVAGSTVRVINLQTKEVLAEFTRYAVEYGRGSTNQRTPWPLAYKCGDSGGSAASTQTRYFVDKVLKPKKGE